MRNTQWLVPLLLAAPIAVLTAFNPVSAQPAPAARPGDPSAGKIQHVVVIMQENQSFDHYFGTYPGVVGLPTDVRGNFTTCMPDPQAGNCIKPYFDSRNVVIGGPHDRAAFETDVDGGKMDGFIAAAEARIRDVHDSVGVMGYRDARVIPNYWSYASHYGLQDHLFESVSSWSLQSHLFEVADWSALCSSTNPASCQPGQPKMNPRTGNYISPLAYTDITYLLHKAGVSWAYYVTKGTEPDCLGGQETCTTPHQTAQTLSVWNPLPAFTDVQRNHQVDNVQSIDNFYVNAQNNQLPAVSWVEPNYYYSEHSSPINQGQAFVTSIVNAVMQSPAWASTAIFLTWDDWGGYYDQVVPPVIDPAGYGLRVPGLIISPWVKPGLIDSQTMSQDEYNKFIEDIFLGGRRLDPATDGRPDPRPTVREALVPGDLLNDFNFNQTPNPALLLPLFPKPGPPSR